MSAEQVEANRQANRECFTCHSAAGLQNPPKATHDFNEVVTSKNDMKYYVSVDGSGNDSVCRYYLVNALNKTADGGYEAPNNQTDKFKSFSYRPASGQVETHINN